MSRHTPLSEAVPLVGNEVASLGQSDLDPPGNSGISYSY